jgi:hypothetical protein
MVSSSPGLYPSRGTSIDPWQWRAPGRERRLAPAPVGRSGQAEQPGQRTEAEGQDGNDDPHSPGEGACSHPGCLRPGGRPEIYDEGLVLVHRFADRKRSRRREAFEPAGPGTAGCGKARQELGHGNTPFTNPRARSAPTARRHVGERMRSAHSPSIDKDLWLDARAEIPAGGAPSWPGFAGKCVPTTGGCAQAAHALAPNYARAPTDGRQPLESNRRAIWSGDAPAATPRPCPHSPRLR